MKNSKRMQAYFSGRVQGVGFRFTAEHFAKNLGLVGWVRNLSDGRVELVAEGSESSLQRLLEELGNYFRDYIRDKNIEWSPSQGDLSSFSIRFH